MTQILQSNIVSRVFVRLMENQDQNTLLLFERRNEIVKSEINSYKLEAVRRPINKLDHEHKVCMGWKLMRPQV